MGRLDIAIRLAPYVLIATACGCAAPLASPAPGLLRNLGVELSEDDSDAIALESSLAAFLEELRVGEFTSTTVELDELDQHRFFFDGLLSAGKTRGLGEPLVLKSYSFDGADYFVTVAFQGERAGSPFLHKVVELHATPHGDGYRFHCPLEKRTETFETTTIGDVRFHYSGTFNRARAKEFVEQRAEIGRLAGIAAAPLDYFAFRSLDELLKCHGFVFDAAKCNFLAHDLGFTDDGGRRYVTGTGDERYLFGYLGDYFETSLPNADEMYGPFLTGICTYYGGYGLSGDSMDTLRAQFRAEREGNPEIDFLEEFKKGRGASIQRHFSFYVMSAFLCAEAVEQRGFGAALRLLYSGEDGARFFEQLETELGVSEANFHETIVRLVG